MVLFRTYFGPAKVAMERPGPTGAEALAADLREVLTRLNRAGERALVAPSEYLQVVTRRS